MCEIREIKCIRGNKNANYCEFRSDLKDKFNSNNNPGLLFKQAYKLAVK